MTDTRIWSTIGRPPDPNRCPYCNTWFVVESMTEGHMLGNRCGLNPSRPVSTKV